MVQRIIKKYAGLCMILLLALTCTVYFGNRKNGYHVDEMYSYGLANSEYLPFMHFGTQEYSVKDWMNTYGPGESLVQFGKNMLKDFSILKKSGFHFKETEIYREYLRAQQNSNDTHTTTWVTGQEYRDYISVNPSNTFNPASVYYNQRGDVHPPLFYLFLHTLCSFFPGSFTKWTGLILNMLYLMLALILWYRTIKDYLGGEKLAFVTCFSWAASCGFVTCFLLIRMYALLTLMCVFCLNIHLRIYHQDFRFTKKNVLTLGLSVFLGFYTHYYFVLYALMLAFVFAVILLCKKKIKALFAYIGTLCGAAAIGLVIWPFAIRHVFGGYRGTASLSILSSGVFYFSRLRVMLRYVVLQLTGNRSWLLVAAAAFLLGVILLRRGKKIPYGKACLLCMPVLFYMSMISQIVPFLTDRYIFCLYPFFVYVLAAGFYFLPMELWKYLLQKKPIAGIKDRWIETGMAVVVLCLLVYSGNCIRNTPGYLSGGQETIVVLEHTDCVYVLPDQDWNESAFHTNVLAKCDRVGVTYESNLMALNPNGEYEPADYVYVFIQKDMDIEGVLKKVRDTLAIEHLAEVSREADSVAVRILLKKE